MQVRRINLHVVSRDCQRTGKSPEWLEYTPFTEKEKGPEGPFFGFRCLRAGRTVDTTWVSPAEAVTLTGFVAHVTGVEIAFEGGFDW